MNKDHDNVRIWLYIAIASALALLLFLTSCKTTEYVEVPVVHTEYIYKESKDTAFVRDSVYIKEVQKGDTIRVTEYRDRYRFRYITTTDTIVRVDSVAVPYPVEVVKVDHSLTAFQKVFFGLGLLGFIGFIIGLILKIKRFIG